MKAKIIIPFVFAVTSVTFSGVLKAQEMKRTEIERHDLTGTNMEVILSVVDVPVGATIARHFHNGEEAVYILEGAQIQLPGKEPFALITGNGAINIRNEPHAGFTVVGNKPLKIVTVHIVDKGKELYMPVK